MDIRGFRRSSNIEDARGAQFDPLGLLAPAPLDFRPPIQSPPSAGPTLANAMGLGVPSDFRNAPMSYAPYGAAAFPSSPLHAYLARMLAGAPPWLTAPDQAQQPSLDFGGVLGRF